MSIDEQAELAQLRRRAYSPNPDIASDSQALRRLIELEERQVATEEEPAPAAQTEAHIDEPAPDAVPAPPRFTVPRPRRSTVIMLAAAALVIATLATALTLVQRVQTDPLQAGATQIARLGVDPDFELPDALRVGSTTGVTGYEPFEGFRVISQPAFTGAATAARCMTIWQPALLDVSGGGGFAYGGEFFQTSCGAGSFPAATSILLRESSPERAQTDFPAGTALQFVYDVANDEIVVFRG